jgi:vacuolar-type H+-ATPase subunit I/STV1
VTEISDLIRALISQVSAQVDKLDTELSALRTLVEKHRHFNQQQRSMLEEKVAKNHLAIHQLSGAIRALEQALERADDLQRAQVSLEEKRIEADVRKTETKTELKSKLGIALVGLFSGTVSALVTLFAADGGTPDAQDPPLIEAEASQDPSNEDEDPNERPVRPID